MKKTIKKIEFSANQVNVITEGIIGCAFKVSNTLGSGFLEKVYENALFHKLRKCGYGVEKQKQMNVIYDDVIVGEYTADMIVDHVILVEIKAAKNLDEAHIAQCINYLKVTGLKICLLFNFGVSKLEFKRLVHDF